MNKCDDQCVKSGHASLRIKESESPTLTQHQSIPTAPTNQTLQMSCSVLEESLARHEKCRGRKLEEEEILREAAKRERETGRLEGRNAVQTEKREREETRCV